MRINYNQLLTRLARVTWRLVSDIRRGPRCTARAGHDIAGPGLHMDLPLAQIRLTAVLGSGDVAPD